MENAKKMIIVSPEVLQRVQNTQHSTVSAASSKVSGDTFSELDREMYRLLNNKNMSDNEKWDQYQQVLQRYLHFASQKRRPVQLPIVDMSESGKPSSLAGPQSSIGNEELVDTFTKTYKKDVRNFLKVLDGKKDLVNWDSDGVVYIEGNKIPHSNIIDLLHDVIRARKSTQPPGWKQLMHVLKEINIPNEFVTNPFSREYLTRIKSGYSERTVDSSSSDTSSVVDRGGGGGESKSVSRKYLDFSTPDKRTSSILGDTYPLGVKSVKTEPVPYKKSKATTSSKAWENFKL